MQTYPLLPEKNRALGIQLDDDGEDQHGNRQNQQSAKREHNINKTLEKFTIHYSIPPYVPYSSILIFLL
jgi:hypothetical protein